MSQIKLKLLYATLFFVFTQGMWERALFFLPQVTYIVDLVVLVFVLFQFKYSTKVPGSNIFVGLIIVSFFIGVVNSNSVIETFLYMRYVFFAYLIYNQIFVLRIHEKEWNRILKFIIGMVLIQGVGGVYNIFLLGERVEGYVGLMSSLGGTTATIFPLFISNILLLYYLFRPKINRKLLVFLGGILMSVFLVGYSSGKRGIYFIIPLFFFFTIVLALPYLIKTNYFKKKIIGMSFIGVFIFPLLIYGMINSRGLNYGLSGNESSVEVIMNSLSYAEDYESSTDQYGRTIGRSNTTSQIVNTSFSESALFFWGDGYGAMKNEDTMLKLGYGYGIVGLTRDLVSGGWGLVLFNMFLISIIIFKNKSLKLTITKVVRRSFFLVFIYTHLFYSSDFTVSLKISLILIILLALINSPVHSVAMVNIFKKNHLIR